MGPQLEQRISERVVLVANDVDIEEAIEGAYGGPAVALHELVHLVGDDNPRQDVLDTTARNGLPAETSDFASLLAMAVNDPDHAIMNPESMTNFAIAVSYNLFVQQIGSNNYAPVVFPVNVAHVPDPFDQLTNITVNNYDVFNDVGDDDYTKPWADFKKTGRAPSSWAWLVKTTDL